MCRLNSISHDRSETSPFVARPKGAAELAVAPDAAQHRLISDPMPLRRAGEPGVGRSFATKRKCAMRRTHVPGFHAFIVRTVGDPRRPLRFGWSWFARPLSAGSFAGFWRYWN